MPFLFAALVLGCLAGRFLRPFADGGWAGRLMTLCVWVLLFLLGAGVGADGAVVARFATLGSEALWLTVGGVVGSGLAVRAFYHYLGRSGALAGIGGDAPMATDAATRAEETAGGNATAGTRRAGMGAALSDGFPVLFFFLVGMAVGHGGALPAALPAAADRFFLCLLLFGAGFSLGHSPGALTRFRRLDRRLLLLPLLTIVGTLGGCAVVAAFLPGRTLADCLAVGSGFGYYSLSSVLITGYRGVEWGAVALMANVLRELTTLLLAPLLVRCFGPLAPLSAGGATSMDTTLPTAVRFAGAACAPLAVYHGVVVDFSVFFLVTLFCSL